MNRPEPSDPTTMSAAPRHAPPDETHARNGSTDPDTSPPVIPGEPPTAAYPAAGEPPTATHPGTGGPTRIGRYEIRRLLGKGGMGAVYLAHDPELDRPVALKVPRLSGPDAEERFLREARAAAHVSHPNLCPVYDAGRADGVLYLAMAYVPGPTLAQFLREGGPLDPAKAAALAAGIARGMAEAHRHGIVHRDLKPGNVLLDRKGEPVVTDFGLARRSRTPDAAADPADPAATAAHDPRLTQAGALMGTPAYMPPEQARGEVGKVGPASDVYALGAVLFEMLTGKPPFRARNLDILLAQIETELAPAPSADRPGVPPKLDAVVRRALAKDPAARFDSMEAFAAALAPFVTARRRKWAGVALAAAFAIVAFAAGVILYIQTDNGTVEVRLNDPAADVQVAIDGGDITVTDGTRVTKLRAGAHSLEVKGPDFETETRVFRVKRGDRTVVEVELKPKAKAGPPAPAVTPKPPDPGPAVVPTPNPADSNRAKLARVLARGRTALDEGRLEDVGKAADEALKIDPQSPTGLALRATFRVVTGNVEGAREDADAALKLNPETWIALVARAMVASEDGKLDEAIADETIAIRLAPNEPRPWANRANSYMNKKEYRQAAADATRAIELGQGGPDALLNRAGAYGCLGEHDKALADFDAAAKVAPNDWRVFDQRSALHAKMKNTAKEQADWKEAKRLNPGLKIEERFVFPDPPKPVERKKLTAEEKANFDRALKAAELAWLMARGPECLKATEEACRIDPTSGAARAMRAKVHIRNRQYADARKEADEAIRLDPTVAGAYTVRGGSKIAANDFAGAIADLTIAILLDPEDHFAWNTRAFAYAERGQHHQALADAEEGVRLNPDAREPRVNRALAFIHLGEYRKALHDYTRLAEMQPTNPQWRMNSAALRAKLGDDEGARKEREGAARLDPGVKDAPDLIIPKPVTLKKDPEIEPAPKAKAAPPKPAPDRVRLAQLLASGRTLVRQNQYLDLAPVVEEALKIDPESPGALALRATLRLHRGDPAGAKADVAAALKLNPETYQALLVRSFISGQEKRHDDSVADATAAARLDPNDPVPLTNRAVAYFEKGEYRQAFADADRAVGLAARGGTFVSPLILRGVAHAHLGEYREALADLDAAEKKLPTEPRIFIHRSAVHTKMRNQEKADADWKTAQSLVKEPLPVALRPTIPDPPKPAERKKLTADEKADLDRAIKVGEAAWDETRYTDCLAAADEACKIDPTCATARSMRARVWGQQGRFKEAVAEATEAIRLNPADAKAYTNRGVARNVLKDHSGAIADHTISLQLDPTSPLAWNNRGFAYLRREQFHQALADVTESLRLKPDHITARLNRAMCHLHLGEYDKALADYEALTRMQPAVARWWRACEVVRARLGDPEGSRAARETAAQYEKGPGDRGTLTLPVPLPPVKRDPEPDGTPAP